jgi:hypothetical protein
MERGESIWSRPAHTGSHASVPRLRAGFSGTGHLVSSSSKNRMNEAAVSALAEQLPQEAAAAVSETVRNLNADGAVALTGEPGPVALRISARR